MKTDQKRTEKLVSALYLVTSFFDDKEPIKWRLRDLGANLVGTNRGELVSEIMSLLRVSNNSGLISDTNFDILNKEFSHIAPQGHLLSEVLKELGEMELPKPMLNTGDRPTEIKEKSYFTSAQTYRPQAPVIKDKMPKDPNSGVVAEKRNSRQDAILDLLKKKREIMVKDLSPLIKGVSEKTIQRELLSMVSKGILKKEGEKRWSKYTLA